MSPEVLRWIEWALLGGAIALLAFLLRVFVNVGRSPGGIDTWYYLAYADAVRARPGFDVRLPQYLLQDERQSYAPLFPMLLALLPGPWLRRWFWAVSPLIDCVHLLLLYWMAFRLTDSILVAALTGILYAFTPQLVSETRSLSGRALGMLLHSLAVLLALRFAMSPDPSRLIMALLSGAAVYLASATASAAYGFVCLILTVVDGDPAYLLAALGALVVATVISGGHFLRVVGNYVSAIRYWRRNRHRYGAHPVRHSPLRKSAAEQAPPPPHAGFLGGNPLQQLVRLLGENPFLIALPFAPYGIFPWGPRLYCWAVSLAALSVLVTLVRPLQILGPGRNYMKAAAFPSAFVLAAGIGRFADFARPVVIATLVALFLSVAAIGFFYWYVRRRATERTSSVPEGLVAAVAHLRSLPVGGFFCLPTVYADYACYHSGKPVLWGGHCGDLSRLEGVAPVVSRPLPELFREYGVRYVLLDTTYAQPDGEDFWGTLVPRGRWETFALYEVGL